MSNVTVRQPILLGLFLLMVALIVIAPDASALSMLDGVNSAKGDGQPVDLFGQGGVITTIVNVLLFIIGALSVIMIIVGGIRYTVSGGNTTSVTNAKNTIMYAIIGLVIAFLAYAAINFVLSVLAPGSNSGYTNV